MPEAPKYSVEIRICRFNCCRIARYFERCKILLERQVHDSTQMQAELWSGTIRPAIRRRRLLNRYVVSFFIKPLDVALIEERFPIASVVFQSAGESHSNLFWASALSLEVLSEEAPRESDIALHLGLHFVQLDVVVVHAPKEFFVGVQPGCNPHRSRPGFQRSVTKTVRRRI